MKVFNVSNYDSRLVALQRLRFGVNQPPEIGYPKSVETASNDLEQAQDLNKRIQQKKQQSLVMATALGGSGLLLGGAFKVLSFPAIVPPLLAAIGASFMMGQYLFSWRRETKQLEKQLASLKHPEEAP